MRLIKQNISKGIAVNLFMAVLFISIMSSCGKNYEFQQEYQINNGKWTYSDSLVFNFEIKDTTQVYDLLLGIQHSLEYPNQNIYLQINAKFPNGHIDQQLRSFDLANKAGTWFGDCNQNGCTYIMPIQKSTFFKEIGNYEFVIKQNMRMDSLDVKTVSLYLSKIQ